MENANLIMTIFLIISVLLNFFLVWFVFMSLRKLLFVSYNLSDLNEAITGFSEHLQSIYELETFYGDETLHSLLKHSAGLVEFLETYEDIYTLTYELLEEEQQEENYDDGTEPEQYKFEAGSGEDKKAEKKGQSQKTVFYSGP